MDDLQILVKAVVDANSETALNSQLSSLVKSVAASHEIKLKVVLDDSSIKTAQSQLQAITWRLRSENQRRKFPCPVCECWRLRIMKSTPRF